MSILFLLYPEERNDRDRKGEWKCIEEKLEVRSTSPENVEDRVLKNCDVIITHRQEYDDNIKGRLINTKSLAFVFSGGVNGINRDNERENTLWVEFPNEIGKTVLHVKKLINGKGTINCQSVMEALINKQSHHHILRSQILTPFVALHLALQDSFDESGKAKESALIFDAKCKNCCADISKQSTALPKQFNGAQSTYNTLRTKIGKLCQIIDNGKADNEEDFKKLYEELCNGGKSGNDLIGDFAGMLEDEINKADLKKNVSTLRHNIKNLLGTIEPNLNGLKNADQKAVREEWQLVKEAILKSGIERVEKELKLYNEIGVMVGKGNDIHKKLKSADELYKALFNIFSSSAAGESINGIMKKGETLIQLLKDTIKNLEEMGNGL